MIVLEIFVNVWKNYGIQMLHELCNVSLTTVNRHSIRLVEYADKLLQANYGNKLNEYEMYLLLAGIYLHDIGMQCDIKKFPDIKTEAENLGAEFKLDFEEDKATKYSNEEQNSIRENHPYLSAAWISYAYKNEQTAVSTAVKSFSRKLVEDLIDVCMYHSKLPIDKCDSRFMYYREMRKKLVAALLRFSDELDIADNRVSLETVKNFSFDAHNSLYWWLHDSTNVSFFRKNLIQLKITLNPEDMEHYGKLVQREFIDKFISKNNKILDVLAEENLFIRIDSDSKVEKSEFTGKLPANITQIFEKLPQKQQQNDNSSIKYEPKLFEFKTKIMQNAESKIRELEHERRIRNLTPEESFSLSIPMLENLKEGDEVMAVSFMEEEKGEWKDYFHLWEIYVDANLIAAMNGATVERIFIMDEMRLRHALKKDTVVKKHTENLKGSFLNIHTYNACSHELRSRIGEGFILINSKSTQEMMAVLDNFHHSEDPDHLDYRTTVTFNKEEMSDIERCFQEIMAISMPLCEV